MCIRIKRVLIGLGVLIGMLGLYALNLERKARDADARYAYGIQVYNDILDRLENDDLYPSQRHYLLLSLQEISLELRSLKIKPPLRAERCTLQGGIIELLQ